MNVLLFISEKNKYISRIEELLNIVSSWAKMKNGKIFVVTQNEISVDVKEVLKEWSIEKLYLLKDKYIYFGYEIIKILEEIIYTNKIDIIAMGNSIFERELAPYLGVKINYEFVPNVINWDFTCNKIFWERFLYGTKAIEQIETKNTDIVVTISSNIYKKDERNNYKTEFKIEELLIGDIDNSNYKVIQRNKKTLQKNHLEIAKIVIGIGKGIKNKNNFTLVEELSETLGATIGATRSVVDNGWRPEYEKIGQTGKIISPNLYIGFGISGAMQHMVGVSKARHIIMINNNPNAECFRTCDLGIVGDLFQIIPRLIYTFKNKK